MAYYLTPAQRRARAQALIKQRKNVVAYNKYLKQQKDYERQVAQAKLDEENRQKQIESQDFFTRAISTVGDISANVITGALKGLEGIYDLGAGIVGAVGGIFSEDFQNSVKSHIATDWVGKYIGDPLQELTKYSYTKNGGIIEGVASGIGQMLPAVAVTIATGGAGAPAAVAQMASLATLGASAAGNATEEAFNDGASYYAGLGYGLASGAVEMATEKMFGGATKALTGAGLLDGITRSVADTGIKRIAKNALEEGVEEIASELVNPLLKSIYKGKDALSDYTSTDYWKGVGQAGIVGSLTALAYSGTVGYGLSKLGVGYVGKEADIADSLSEIATLKEKGTNLQASGKLNEQAEIKIADTVRKNYQNIESVLKKASPDKRATLIKKFSLEKAFSSEGAMSEKLGSWLNATQAVEQTTEGGEKPSSELASPKKEYYSFGLRGSEQTIQSDLQRMSEDRRKSYAEKNGVTIEEATEKVGDIKVFDGEMSKQAQERFTKMKKGLNILNKMGDNNVSFVVTEANEIFNGTMVDGRTMYIAADTFENDTWAGTLVHEYTHFAEGTKEYGKLFDYLQSDDIQVEGENGEKVQLWRKAQDSIFGQDYGLSEDEVGRIKAKIDNGEALTEQERRYYNEFASEVGARMSEYLLGNETFIDKVVAKDSSIARKFITKIQNLMKMFKRIGSDTKAEFKQLKKAEKLYLAAARKAGNQALIRKILKGREERGEDTDEAIDASPQSEYNGEEVAVQHSRKNSLINHTFPTYKESAGNEANTLATRWAHRADIQAGDQTLISYHDNWYVVQKFDDSDLGYQIMERIAKKDYDKIAEDIKRNGASGRIQSIQRAFTDFAQFDKQRDSARRAESSPHSLQIEHGGENSEVLRDSKTATPRGQTQNDGGGDSKSRRSSKQGLKYSFKEVSESALADLQGERDLALQEEKRTQKVLDSIEGYAEQKEKLYKVLNDKTASDYAVNAAMEEYAQWEKESGYGEAYKANYEASRKANELRREVERMGEELSKKLTAKKFTTEEISGYVQKAIRKFHTTPYLNRASYLLTTGSMLDFSDGQGYRVQDYREISEILNLPDYAEYSTGMIMFMNMGNIRLQTYGIDIAAMPNDKQVSALRGIIQNVMNEYDEFVVDFSKSNGNSDGSITYPQGISSARIISDIKKYFETGVLPEEPSDISRFRYSLKIGDETVGTQGKYNFNTESERVLKDIILQNDIENFLPKGLSKDFIRAIRSYGNFAFPRLYRGMEAAEFENLKKNGYIKSKGEYNFSNQQGETFFSRDVREAFSYATGFAPAGIREKFFEQGQPAYIVEVGNFGDLNFKYNSVKESSTKKEVDTKYITRILELRYNQSDKKVYIKDVGIDGMNSANGEAIHGEPIFVKDKTTGQILYAVQDEEGYETGAYISEAEPGLIVDYNKLKNAPQYEVDFRTKAANISGNEADLILYDGESRIKHSLKDSEGKTLSEGQQKYFKDSKVRDNEGNLLVVYHGTMSGDFTVFDASYSNVESDLGAGFYFSSDYADVNNNYENGGEDLEAKIERLAERIAADEDIDEDEAKQKARKQLSKKSKLFEVYLDMKNPAYVGGNFDSSTYLFEDYFDFSDIQEDEYESDDEYWEARDKRVEELIQELVDKVDRILSAEGITGYEGWEQNLAVMGAFDGGVTIADMKNTLNEDSSLWDCCDSKGNMATTELVRAIIEALGYDGIIDNSVVDKFGYNSGRIQYMEGIDEEPRHFVVFKPEQIKLTDNLNPTTNEDIRFSRKVTDEIKKTYYHLSDGQIKKMLANSTRYKVYSKADAEGIINNVLQNYMSFGEKYGDMSGKTKAQVIDMLWKGLNSAKPGYQMSVALNIADYIIQNSILESLYGDMENGDVQQALDIIGALKPYLHNINLDSLKGEIKYKYDKDNSAYLLWGKRKGERGYGADQIAQELQERGIFIDAINEAEIFFEIDAQYRNAVKALKKRAKEMLSESLSKEQQKELRQEIAREVLRGFDYTGKPSQLAGILDKYRKQISMLYEK